LSLLAANAYAQRLYRYVDENGVVHYSDRVPAEHASQDRDVLNDQALQVGFEQGVLTEDERAALEQERLAEEQAHIETEDAARRDRVLLETYLSVADIEDLRDRRLELIDSQITVTEIYLGNLRKKLEGLNRDRTRFAPFSGRENAPPIPENLALDIAQTESSIVRFEERLEESKATQEEIRRAFQADIERFKELKGG
jgi:hypothetical protein